MNHQDDPSGDPQLSGIEQRGSPEDSAWEETSGMIPIPGTAQAILQALHSIQPIPESLIDEMEEAIRQGKMPANDEPVFDDGDE